MISLTEHLQADSTGTQPIDDALDALNGLTPKEEVGVAPGNYLIEGPVTIDGINQVSFKATGETKPTFIAPEGTTGEWLNFECDVFFDRIRIDRRRPTTSPLIRLSPRLKSLFQDVEILGDDDSDEPAGTGLFAIRDTDSETKFAFNGLIADDGSTWASDTFSTYGRSIIHADATADGHLWIGSSSFTESPGPAIDTVDFLGKTEVQTSEFTNCNGPQIRFSGVEDLLKGNTFTIDPAASQNATSDFSADLCGVEITEQQDSRGEVRSGRLIRNAFKLLSGSPVAGVYGTNRALGTAIRTCDFTVDVPVHAIRFEAPDTSVFSTQKYGTEFDVQIEDVLCEGAATQGLAIEIQGRSESQLQESCIEEKGDRIPFVLPSGESMESVDRKPSCRNFRALSDDGFEA